MAYLSVVVPNRINNGTDLPKVTVLVQGLKLPVYGADGSYISDQFSRPGNSLDPRLHLLLPLKRKRLRADIPFSIELPQNSCRTSRIGIYAQNVAIAMM